MVLGLKLDVAGRFFPLQASRFDLPAQLAINYGTYTTVRHPPCWLA